MDHDRFDGLTRSLGAAASRRTLGRALAGGGLGTLLGSAFGALEVDAKKKRHKKNRKRKTRKVTRTVRGPVTQTFTSTAPITIPAPMVLKGKANPYPATMTVSGFSNGVITDINLILNDFTHTYPSDVNVLLSTSDGRQAFVMGYVGSEHDVENLDLTLDDEAAAPLSESPLTSGTFRPTQRQRYDVFAAPAPTPNGNVALSVFDGADPNGMWQVWVMDDGNNEIGIIDSWALQITAEADVQVQERVKAKKHKKKGKKRR
jgi:hypothetical protein